MRTSLGPVVAIQLGTIVMIGALMALANMWLPAMFWVVYIGLFVAIDAGLLLHYQMDRRRGRR